MRQLRSSKQVRKTTPLIIWFCFLWTSTSNNVDFSDNVTMTMQCNGQNYISAVTLIKLNAWNGIIYNKKKQKAKSSINGNSWILSVLSEWRMYVGILKIIFLSDNFRVWDWQGCWRHGWNLITHLRVLFLQRFLRIFIGGWGMSEAVSGELDKIFWLVESNHAGVRLAESLTSRPGARGAPTDLLLGLGADQRLVRDREAGPGHQDVGGRGRGCPLTDVRWHRIVGGPAIGGSSWWWWSGSLRLFRARLQMQ